MIDRINTIVLKVLTRQIFSKFWFQNRRCKFKNTGKKRKITIERSKEIESLDERDEFIEKYEMLKLLRKEIAWSGPVSIKQLEKDTKEVPSKRAQTASQVNFTKLWSNRYSHLIPVVPRNGKSESCLVHFMNLV